MSLSRRSIWCSPAQLASSLDRRSFMLGGTAAAAACACAPPLWAKGAATYPAPTQELMVPGPGGKLYVRINGRLDGPRLPLLMIHGGPGGTHAGFLDALGLAEDRAVVLYDQLDSGRSDRPGNPANWTVQRFTDEVDAVRRALGIKRWHVLGHSWGGTIALEYGARRPPELAGLVLASPLISTRSWIADANALRKRLPAAIQSTLRGCDPPRAVTSACEGATNVFYANFNGREPRSDAMTAYIRDHPELRLNTRLYETMWGSSEFVSTGTLRRYNGEPLLSRLNGSHTLFMVGQYDEARPVTAAVFAERVAGSEFAVVPGAAHGFFRDRPDEAIGILRPWLKQQDAA